MADGLEIRGSTLLIDIFRAYPGAGAEVARRLIWPCAHCGGAFSEPLTMAAIRHRNPPRAVLEVAAHPQVRKQPRILEHIADAPALGRHLHTGGAVEPHVAVERHAPAGPVQQSGQQVHQRGLAAAGTAKQRDDARRGRRHVDIQQELALPTL